MKQSLRFDRTGHAAFTTICEALYAVECEVQENIFFDVIITVLAGVFLSSAFLAGKYWWQAAQAATSSQTPPTAIPQSPAAEPEVPGNQTLSTQNTALPVPFCFFCFCTVGSSPCLVYLDIQAEKIPMRFQEVHRYPALVNLLKPYEWFCSLTRRGEPPINWQGLANPPAKNRDFSQWRKANPTVFHRA